MTGPWVVINSSQCLLAGTHPQVPTLTLQKLSCSFCIYILYVLFKSHTQDPPLGFQIPKIVARQRCGQSECCSESRCWWHWYPVCWQQGRVKRFQFFLVHFKYCTSWCWFFAQSRLRITSLVKLSQNKSGKALPSLTKPEMLRQRQCSCECAQGADIGRFVKPQSQELKSMLDRLETKYAQAQGVAPAALGDESRGGLPQVESNMKWLAWHRNMTIVIHYCMAYCMFWLSDRFPLAILMGTRY